MSFIARSCLVTALALPFASDAIAQSGSISWNKDLTAAFAEAKKTRKILMICVNAKYVDGRKTEESANKGLREVVYKDTRVVFRSKEFVCALLTPGSGSSDFGELRLLGIEGAIVSPQHIFVHPDGKKILLRKQYWSHGNGDPAARALLAMMKEAQAKLKTPDAPGPEGGEQPKAAAGDPPPLDGAPKGDGRAEWITKRINEVKNGSQAERKAAIGSLIRNDKGGDCTRPLIALIEEHKKNTALLVDLIRGLGYDELGDAALPIVRFLTHKDEKLRGNAAVSLEYIGSRDPKVVSALRRAAVKEKDEDIANHLYRALGRCGVEDSKARSTILKKIGGAKSEFMSYGPTIALSYFDGDAKAARGLEKILKKIGAPGGRRGGGQNTVKRGVLCWTLACIGDKKSAAFMREELIAKLEHVKAFWVAGLLSFYKAVARCCDGEKDAIAGIGEGVRGFVGYAKRANAAHYDKEARSLMDEYRKGRDDGGFAPKGDYLLGDG